MSNATPQYLDAHLPPEPLVVPNFWLAWEHSCLSHFPGCQEDIAVLQEVQAQWKTGELFMHLDDGLEHLLLANRANIPLPLTPKHWLSLVWLVLAAYDGTQAQHTTTLALEKAIALYKEKQGNPVEGITMQEWMDRGPWEGNTPLWTLLFKHNLALVHPNKDPLCWALRDRWLAWEQEDVSLSKQMHLQVSPPDLSSWALPRPMNLENIQNVLRCGKRWSTRMGLTLNDADVACIAAPQWRGVYLFSLWLVQHDAGRVCTDEERALMRQYLVPTDLAYWLLLAHDHHHHKGQYRNTIQAWDLNTQPDYESASHLLAGLQLLAAHSETQLALAAWAQWHLPPEMDSLALPDLV